ncbi:MAG: sulfur carrier protein ThiS [Verrucomicrobia bacterium]|nr:sulfur carrier protein ThiS [Verrucomicrobiota bacterium]
MLVSVNGEQKDITEQRDLRDLLQELGYDTACVAVAINRAFVPKSLYNTTLVSDGDAIDVLSPMQGG